MFGKNQLVFRKHIRVFFHMFRMFPLFYAKFRYAPQENNYCRYVFAMFNHFPQISAICSAKFRYVFPQNARYFY